jgi:hypothetical protein
VPLTDDEIEELNDSDIRYELVTRYIIWTN